MLITGVSQRSLMISARSEAGFFPRDFSRGIWKLLPVFDGPCASLLSYRANLNQRNNFRHTKFSEFSDTGIVFSGWFSMGNYVLDMVFHGFSSKRSLNSKKYRTLRSDRDLAMYFLCGRVLKTYLRTGPLLGKSTKIFVIIHLRKRKIQWFPPLPLKFPMGPLVGPSTI